MMIRVVPEILSPTQRRLKAVQDVIYFTREAGPEIIKQAVGLTQGQATIGQPDLAEQRTGLRGEVKYEQASDSFGIVPG